MRNTIFALLLIVVAHGVALGQARTAESLMDSTFSGLNTNNPRVGSVRNCINCRRANGACVAASVGETPIGSDAVKFADGWMCSARSSGAGSGTVTSFSAGDLSPLFTTTETNPTTTPALAFSLNTQTAKTFLAGPTTGSAAAPTFRSIGTGDVVTGTVINTRCLRVSGSGNIEVASADCSSGGGGTWGSITGTLSDQTDLQSALDLKANLAGPTFTGTVTIPTPFTLGATSVTATGAELNHNVGVTSALQTQLNAKQGTLTNSAGLAAALSDETGTGLAVFATSPALTTPNIGAATGTSLVASGAVTAASFATSATSAGAVTLSEPTGTGSDGVTIKAPASVTTSYDIVLPAVSATGFYLGTDTANVNALTFVGFTGTANVVRATSPTLTTPDIGTPSAGVVTNLSGTLTNIAYNAEGTGNTLTSSYTVEFTAAGCNNTTASSFWDLPTSTPAVPACVTGTNIQKGVLDFADTSGGFSAQTHLLLPADFTGTVDASIKWFTSATSGNAKWSLSTICTATNATETDDPAFNTASTVTTAAPGTANRLQTSNITTLTITGCAADEIMHLRIFRDGNDGSDTLAATARLTRVLITYRRAQ